MIWDKDWNNLHQEVILLYKLVTEFTDRPKFQENSKITLRSVFSQGKKYPGKTEVK